MAEMVWIRSDGAPDKGALAFPLDSSGKRLVLDGIAGYFALDPSSLTIGRVVLLKDANGLSLMDIDQIRQVSLSAGLGDGLSEQTPIIITGTSAVSAASGSRSTRDMVLKALVQAFRGNRKRPGADLKRERELVKCRTETMWTEFYENGVYSYTRELDEANAKMSKTEHVNFVGETLSKFLGSVHLVARKQGDGQEQQERSWFKDLADNERQGVVTLVKPNGICLTAEKCIEGFEDAVTVIVVKFPRLGVCYECKVAACDNAVAILEPVRSHSFDACVDFNVVGMYPISQVLTYGSYEKLDVVVALSVDFKRSYENPEVILLPAGPLRELGAPVFGRNGAMTGVVVVLDGGNLSKRPRTASRKLKSMYGKELKIQLIGDLNAELELRRSREKIGQDGVETVYDVMVKAIAHNQLAECTFPVHFRSPIEDWNEEHPLESELFGWPAKCKHKSVHFTTSANGRINELALSGSIIRVCTLLGTFGIFLRCLIYDGFKPKGQQLCALFEQFSNRQEQLMLRIQHCQCRHPRRSFSGSGFRNPGRIFRNSRILCF